uniref:Uncharacterized protein n=1 Tax=Rhizophora mucronata TaxID=61149 RepID=A0A2P2QZV0_RHIMU
MKRGGKEKKKKKKLRMEIT